jgi:hypothetical protein
MNTAILLVVVNAHYEINYYLISHNDLSETDIDQIRNNYISKNLIKTWSKYIIGIGKIEYIKEQITEIYTFYI